MSSITNALYNIFDSYFAPVACLIGIACITKLAYDAFFSQPAPGNGESRALSHRVIEEIPSPSIFSSAVEDFSVEAQRVPETHPTFQDAAKALQARVARFSLDYNPALLENGEFFQVFELVADALNQENPKDAFELFQKIAYDHLEHAELALREIHPTALRIALYCKNRNISDIASALLRAMEAKLTSASSSSDIEKVVSKSEEFPSWAEKNKCESKKIKISWGGGDRFLTEFLEGESEGYAREAGGRGIFVTTSDSFRDRDSMYATRTPIYHFDNPCTLQAEIDPQLLLQVNHNGYEAVLPQQHVHLLENIQRQSWDMSKIDFLRRKSFVYQTLPTCQLDFKTLTTNWRPMLVRDAGDQYSAERIERFALAYNEFTQQ